MDRECVSGQLEGLGGTVSSFRQQGRMAVFQNKTLRDDFTSRIFLPVQLIGRPLCTPREHSHHTELAQQYLGKDML